jgi:lysophospholipase L1-like esterase
MTQLDKKLISCIAVVFAGLIGPVWAQLDHVTVRPPATNVIVPQNRAHAFAPRFTTYLSEIKELMQQKWPNNRTVNIVCHGHSVPAGYFKTPVVDTFNAYPHLLHEALKKKYPFAVINVIVTAIGGETSDSGERRFEKDVLSHRPDVITIDYALNDRRIGLDKSREALTSMIEQARSRGIKVILLTPTGDLSADLGNPEADSLEEFRAYISNGGRMEDLMSQGNHPNRKGHELVVKVLMDWF